MSLILIILIGLLSLVLGFIFVVFYYIAKWIARQNKEKMEKELILRAKAVIEGEKKEPVSFFEENKNEAIEKIKNAEPVQKTGPAISQGEYSRVVKKETGPEIKPAEEKKQVVEQDRMEMLKGAEIKIPKNMQNIPAEAKQATGSVIHQDRLGELKTSEIKIPQSAIKSNLNNKSADDSVFGGKQEITRSEMRQKLRTDYKSYKAARDVGLNMTAMERTKMEKEVLPQAYGRNISRNDLRLGVRKLNEKMLDAKTITEKGKIRKEIKFLKKIGGLR